MPTATPTPSPTPTFVPATADPDLRLRKSFAEVTPGLYQRRDTEEYLRFGSFGQEPLAFYSGSAEEDPVYGAEAQPQETVFLSPYAPQDPPRREGARALTVYLGSESVVCFLAKDGDWTVERVMICSTGFYNHRTPLGTHRIYAKYKYKALTRMNGIMVYGQYASRFQGHYLFHTVPIGGEGRETQNNGKKQMLVAEYEMLGSPASHGCVRMLVGDACWIYKNCAMGTRVYVTREAGPPPPAAPALIYEEPYMNEDQTLGWDPTDPDPENPYRDVYPEWFTA